MNFDDEKEGSDSVNEIQVGTIQVGTEEVCSTGKQSQPSSSQSVTPSGGSTPLSLQEKLKVLASKVSPAPSEPNKDPSSPLPDTKTALLRQ